MSGFKYYSISGKSAEVALPNLPFEARRVSAQIDDRIVERSFFQQVGWYTETFASTGMIKHDSDELLVFAGGDPDDPENLFAEIEIQLENDVLTLTDTCVVFVPAGAAHGNMKIKRLDKPVFYYITHMNAGSYQVSPAEATAPQGTYLGNKVERYEPVSGKIPEAPEGFLQLLLWLDGQKTPGAPYMETVWFKSVNDSGPAPHAHEFDELIGFIGSDPEHPRELGATVDFDIEGELVSVTESTIVYIPRGVTHSPILVPKMDHPIYHFSIGNGGDYVRQGNKGDSNVYKPD